MIGFSRQARRDKRLDIARRAREIVETGLSVSEVCLALGIHRSLLYRALAEFPDERPTITQRYRCRHCKQMRTTTDNHECDPLLL